MAKKGLEESEYHVVGVKMRVVGNGTLDMSLEGIGPTVGNMVGFTLAATNPIEPTRLVNFQSQRTKFRASVDQVDEYFTISRIIIFVKPVSIEYPM